MSRGRIWLFAVVFLILADGGPTWAQDLAGGKQLYVSYCSGCHGDKGMGDGPAAKSLPIKPGDHTNGKLMNQLPDRFLEDIISKGGTAVGKSPMMPAWGSQLKEKQLRDLMAYLRSIADPPYKAHGK